MFIDIKSLQEDLRKIAIALFVAGFVGIVLKKADILLSIYIVFIGLFIWFLGLYRNLKGKK